MDNRRNHQRSLLTDSRSGRRKGRRDCGMPRSVAVQVEARVCVWDTGREVWLRCRTGEMGEKLETTGNLTFETLRENGLLEVPSKA